MAAPAQRDPEEGPRCAAPDAAVRRVLLGAAGAAVAFGLFLALAGMVAAPGAPAASASSGTVAPEGLALVVRTPANLRSVADVEPLVRRFDARGVDRAWVQVKQDETDEFAAGTLFHPSGLAPAAAGSGDGRLRAFTDGLAARGIAPMAWMPVLHDARAAAAHPEWRARTIAEDGRLVTQDEWLCPFHPAVARYQAALAADAVRRLPSIEGLYLDFIRYDDDYSCVTPGGLAELERRTGWRARTGRALTPRDIRRAGTSQGPLWTAWTSLRAEKIVETINVIRDAVDAVRPDLHMGAFVLPFSSTDYDLNTQAGQDLEKMAQAGIDEIVLMGYWDDWDKSPAWLRESLDGARDLVDGEAELSVVLDGDMGVRRTRLTLEAIGPWAEGAGWFNYGAWTEREFDRLERAIDGHREGPMPRPDHVSVVVRVDTEPDYRPSYATVHPWMIDALVGMFGEEGVSATFVTVGKLAERQPGAVARAAAAGHEIASHSYDHEQLDALPVEAQMESVDGGLAALGRLGFTVRGFGAPRNSITDESRDRLIDWNLEYDGSAAYDPLLGLLDVHYAAHSQRPDERIVVVPFVIPNDWDARWVADMSAEEMLSAWTRRLDAVVASGEPVFVLDVHQWAISDPENLEVLRAFIRYAKDCSECRVETLREAARNARAELDRYEPPATTSGSSTLALASPAPGPSPAEARP
jgi:peptidoglycan/xylan/chitin deacetylase (PgdA/CDA1 family)